MTVAADPLAVDLDWLATLSADEIAEVYAELDEDERRSLTKAVEDREPWRDNPAVFAHELTKGTPDEWHLWDYVRLLGCRFRDAYLGVDPHQIWMLPSQYGKTSGLIWGVLWILDRDPRARIMYLSYDADRAVDEGGKARDLATRYADRLRFRLRPDSQARGKWSTTEGGSLYCVGVGGAITGFPQDVLLCDDLIKGWREAHSEANRIHVRNVYRSQARMRLQSHVDPIIVAGTRWHEADIQAWLREQSDSSPEADQFSVVRLPALAEPPNLLAVDPLLRQADPLGRAPGEVLESERFDRVEVLARRASLGEYLAAALEQQRPAPAEGNVLKREWWRLDLEDLFDPETATRWLSSWDMKLKEKESGDYTVGQVWARSGSALFLVDQIRGQWDQPTAQNAMALMVVRHPRCRRHIFENTGYGPEVAEALRTAFPDYEVSEDTARALGMTEAERVLVQEIRRRGLGGLIPNNPKGNKTVRAVMASPYIEAGDVHLPEHAPWLPVFLEEMAAFGPGAAHDDQVDAMSQAVAKLHRIGGGKGGIGMGVEQRETRAASAPSFGRH